jgi:hypothetical protein
MIDIIRPLYDFIEVSGLNEKDIVVYLDCIDDFKNIIIDLDFQIRPLNEAPKNTNEICTRKFKDYRPLINKFNMLIKSFKNKEKIVIIKRSKNRILINHNILFESLKQNFNDDYEIEEAVFEKKTLVEQKDMLTNCKVLIGPHGAGFTNILFLNENTKIIELFPESFWVGCYKKLAIEKKVNYYYLHGKDTIPPSISIEEFKKLEKDGKIWGPDTKLRTSLRDIKGFTINVDEVMNLIKTTA